MSRYDSQTPASQHYIYSMADILKIRNGKAAKPGREKTAWHFTVLAVKKNSEERRKNLSNPIIAFPASVYF